MAVADAVGSESPSSAGQHQRCREEQWEGSNPQTSTVLTLPVLGNRVMNVPNVSLTPASPCPHH